MKKILFLLLALPTLLMAQQKVAVYVSAPEGFDPEVKDIFASELVTGIAQNKEFKAIERSAEFGQLKAIQVDGYLLSPVVYKFQVPPMKPKDEIRFDIPRP